ncbi:hypothetical protein NE237_033122 [Protea cynaroides]|uniref:Uncharacterized protein n=1 Tax=Protea cynaroides TaxID=273540 RepID=A0A9Q0R3R3_9MAGN|nr:hypothetical protein NE237_033122 [Protea cynaroides]
MRIPEPSMQPKVTIKAVDNHMPEAFFVDEIGIEAEGVACRSIVERGVMGAGTARGERLENMIKNHTPCDLIGRVETITLGDEKAELDVVRRTFLKEKLLQQPQQNLEDKLALLVEGERSPGPVAGCQHLRHKFQLKQMKKTLIKMMIFVEYPV